jgi:flagellar basal-body rod modification protein FlgD
MFITPLTSSAIDAYNARGGEQADATDPQASQDRFLRLFIAQLNNQDPLNPMDNAQMTTQMAQINTVTGIQQVNQTLKSLADQFSMGQALQGASLVGRQVIAQGNALAVDGSQAQGSFSLTQPADNVRVDIMSSTGELLGTVNMGPRSAGMHNFNWPIGALDPSRVASMQVHAFAGGQAVAATPLARQTVESVAPVDGALRLRTSAGMTLSFQQVLAFL